MTLRWALGVAAGAALAGWALLGQTPVATQIPAVKFSRGQNVVPTYEGWLRNADGTFTFVFGYFNRNWEEELVIPPGPENKLEPGEVDRGQPTYFLPRRQRWVFRVQVPRDWGNKELVWTITSNGRTDKAYASLMPQEEITERLIMTRGNLSPGLDDPNKPPTVSIAPPGTVSAGTPVTLTAMASDDGLPRPRVAPAVTKGVPQAQSNTVATARPRGLAVNWYQYRGPARIEFDQAGPALVSNGQAVTMARFAQPGVYVLRAVASDGGLAVTAETTVTVAGR